MKDSEIEKGRGVSLDPADVRTLLAVVPNATGHRYRPLWERINEALLAHDRENAPARTLSSNTGEK